MVSKGEKKIKEEGGHIVKRMLSDVELPGKRRRGRQGNGLKDMCKQRFGKCDVKDKTTQTIFFFFLEEQTKALDMTLMNSCTNETVAKQMSEQQDSNRLTRRVPKPCTMTCNAHNSVNSDSI